jgi:diacylglycerol kinase family enzyme
MRDVGADAMMPEPEPELARPDICVLINAGSGKQEDRRGELEALFQRHPGRFTIRTLGEGSDFERTARAAIDQGFGTIVAAGGDGTISGIAPLVAAARRRLGVLPFGTFNYFARSLDIPEDLEQAVEVLAGDRVREVPVGEVNGEAFLNNASLGAYAAILTERERVYKRWGRSRLAAYLSVLTTLARFRSPLTFRVTVDGELRRMRSPLIFVANNAYQLDQFGLPGAECVASGRFALFIAPDCTRLEMIAFALRLAFRSVVEGRDFELMCGREIVVETRQTQRSVARDGERERMSAPFRFSMRPDLLQVLVPASAATKAAR